MAHYRWLLGVLAGIIVLAGAQELSTKVSLAQPKPPPPIPAYYSGTASVGGLPAHDGLEITARIEDYVTHPGPDPLLPISPIVVQNGLYEWLQVSPPDGTFIDKTITFYIDGVQADQTATFKGTLSSSYNFTFNLTALPKPTPTPTVTATPEIAQPAVYSGPIIVAQGVVPEGAELVARVDSYESFPALIQGQDYKNLVVYPVDVRFVGQRVEFFLNGVRSGTTDVYESGKFSLDFRLVFVGVPTPVPTPVPPTSTATPVPSTTTPPPTQTPVTPSPTPLRPTPAPAAIPPTSTATPVPPTVTPLPLTPASIDAEPTSTPVPSSGFCGSAYERTPTASGVSSLLALLAPLGLIVGYRRWQG